MIKKFLENKYGKFITEQLLTENNEVLYDNIAKKENENQDKVSNLLHGLKDFEGNNLVPKSFLNNSIEWGVDFSSWIGQFNKEKEYFFIGAEPHLWTNYQLVYDFGNFKGKEINEIAKIHFERENDIWNYLTKIFVDELNEKNITDFLKKCYITDLCHLVPKHCGQVKDIKNKLSIKIGDWKKFRTVIAKEFLIEEIKIVNPKFVILHGNPSREFFRDELGVIYTKVYIVANSTYKILTGELNGYRIISIPHLKGDVKNKLWKCKKYPERPESAKQILRSLIS